MRNAADLAIVASALHVGLSSAKSVSWRTIRARHPVPIKNLQTFLLPVLPRSSYVVETVSALDESIIILLTTGEITVLLILPT